MFQHELQYICDHQGNRTHLPIEAYENFVDEVLDARDIQQLPELRESAKDAEKMTIEELARRCELEPEGVKGVNNAD